MVKFFVDDIGTVGTGTEFPKIVQIQSFYVFFFLAKNLGRSGAASGIQDPSVFRNRILN